MKKFENLGRSLSKEEQKKIGGGDPPGGGCYNLGDDCNEGVQCCSTVCRAPGGPSTGKLCYES